MNEPVTVEMPPRARVLLKIISRTYATLKKAKCPGSEREKYTDRLGEKLGKLLNECRQYSNEETQLVINTLVDTLAKFDVIGGENTPPEQNLILDTLGKLEKQLDHSSSE